MSKVYDQVEWDFMKDIMLKIGFEPRWVSLALKYIQSVSHSNVFNGDLIGPIFPSKDLIQGTYYPLSLYFI